MSLAEFDKHLECAKLEARQGREKLAVRHLEEARVIVDEIACKRIDLQTGERVDLDTMERVGG